MVGLWFVTSALGEAPTGPMTPDEVATAVSAATTPCATRDESAVLVLALQPDGTASHVKVTSGLDVATAECVNHRVSAIRMRARPEDLALVLMLDLAFHPAIAIAIPRQQEAPPSRKAGIDAGIQQQSPQIQRGYSAEVAEDPKLAGKMTVHFVIAPTGAVESAEVRESTLGNARLEECVVNAIRALRLPLDGPNTTEVNYPFVFGPADAPSPPLQKP